MRVVFFAIHWRRRLLPLWRPITCTCVLEHMPRFTSMNILRFIVSDSRKPHQSLSAKLGLVIYVRAFVEDETTITNNGLHLLRVVVFWMLSITSALTSVRICRFAAEYKLVFFFFLYCVIPLLLFRTVTRWMASQLRSIVTTYPDGITESVTAVSRRHLITRDFNL